MADNSVHAHQETIKLEAYLLDHIDKEPPVLAQLRRLGHLRLVHPRMISGHLQGRLLKMLVRMIAPNRILEIGTYTGYATICMAEGLPTAGHIDTIEINDELEDFIREGFDLSHVSDRVTLHIGDAEEIIPQLPIEEIQLIYMDANKRHYVTYLSLLIDRLPVGAFIIADNTLWDGKVIDANATDQQTEGIRAFNDWVADSTRVERVILPIRDGLTIIHKVK